MKLSLALSLNDDQIGYKLEGVFTLYLPTGRLRKLGTGHALFILGYLQYEISKSKQISFKNILLSVIYFLFHPN